MDINLTITRGKHQELNLTAKTMNELVEKIKDWQDYDDYVSTVKQFKKQPTEEKLKKEKESGWYYINSVKKLTLTDISQQRELLLAYEDYLDEYHTKEDRIKQVDKYLKNKYWEKPKKIELDLESMASSEMIGNIKGLKK